MVGAHAGRLVVVARMQGGEAAATSVMEAARGDGAAGEGKLRTAVARLAEREREIERERPRLVGWRGREILGFRGEDGEYLYEKCMGQKFVTV